MKNIKKSIFVLLTVLLFSVVLNVNAAYAYKWTVNGKVLSRGDSTENASWKTSDDYTGGILTLNNYNGGQLKIECVGTGMADQVFAIKLVGDNTITVDKGVGIIANANIVFIGDGKLTIKAAVPIGSGGIINSDSTTTEIEKAKFNQNTTSVIIPSVTVKEVEKEGAATVEEDEEETSNEEKLDSSLDTQSATREVPTSDEDKDNKLLMVVLAATGCLLFMSIIVIIVLAINIGKKNKEKTSD